MRKITIVVASSGKNLELAQMIKQQIDEQKFKTAIISLDELELPLYTVSNEGKGIPKNAMKLTDDLVRSDALIILSPEYNGGVAPSLNNAISWISRSNKDWRAAFNGKMTIIGTHSGSGGSHVLMAMRLQLSYVGANVLGKQILTNDNKELNIDLLKSALNEL